MHRLRLRSKSVSNKDEGGRKEKGRQNRSVSSSAAGASNSKSQKKSSNASHSLDRQGNDFSTSSLKSRIQHVGADAVAAGHPNGLIHLDQGTGNNSQGQRAKSRPLLAGDEKDFRTSLILPHLTKRFTLLRAEDGSLVSLDQMQAHLRAQRETGRLTEFEEQMVLQQFHQQSIYETSNSIVNGLGNGYHGRQVQRPLQTTWEENETDEVIREGAYLPALSQSASRLASNGGEHVNFSRPTTRNSNPSRPGTSHSVISGSAEPGYSTPLTSPNTLLASPSLSTASAAEFYAARDAALRGNSLFGGGGLEREVVSKMTRSHSNISQASQTPSYSATSSPMLPYSQNYGYTPPLPVSAQAPQSPASDGGATPRRKPKKHASTTGRFGSLSPARSTSSSPKIGTEGSSGEHGPYSPSQMDVPPLPSINQYSPSHNIDDYDPYRPKSLDDADNFVSPTEDQQIGTSMQGLAISADLDAPMTRKQINRISKVLEDIEAELTKTHHRIQEDPIEEEHDDLFDTTSSTRNDAFYQYQQRRLSHDDYNYDDFFPSDQDADIDQDHSAEYQYNPEDHQKELDRRGTFYSSSMSDQSHTGTTSNDGGSVGKREGRRATRNNFIYDDTEEIDPPRNRLPFYSDEPLPEFVPHHAATSSNGSGHRPPPIVTTSRLTASDSEYGLAHSGETPAASNFPPHQLILPERAFPKDLELHQGASSANSDADSPTLDIYDSYRPVSLQPSLAPSSTISAVTDRNSSGTGAEGSSSTIDVTASGSHLLPPSSLQAPNPPSPALSSGSDNLPYLRPSPVLPATKQLEEQAVPLSATEKSATLPPSDSFSSDGPPPISAVQPTFSTLVQQEASQIHPYTGLQRSLYNKHIRNISSASSISTHSPPLSPPPTCGLPPLPADATYKHQSQLFDQARYTQLPPSDSESSSLHRTAGAVAMTRLARDNSATSIKSAANGSPVSPSGSSHMPPRYMNQSQQSIASLNSQIDGLVRRQAGREFLDEQPNNVHTDKASIFSTGSSWRGHSANPSESDIDLNRLLGESSHPALMGDIDEDHEDGLEEAPGSTQDDAVREFLASHTPGLNLDDLRRIQETMFEGAMIRSRSQSSSLDAALAAPAKPECSGNVAHSDGAALLTPPAGNDGDYEETPRASGLRHSATRISAVEATGNSLMAILNSPDAVCDPASKSITSPQLPTKQSTRDVILLGSPLVMQDPEMQSVEQTGSNPDPNDAQVAESPVHNGLSSPLSAPLTRNNSTSSMRNAPHHARQHSSPSLLNRQHLAERQRFSEDTASTDTSLQASNISSESTDAAIASPPTPSRLNTLRAKPTRAADSTPSMLLRHVRQQATEATMALKNQTEPLSSNQAVPSPGPRRALSHRKSVKNLKIGAPQFVSTSANLEQMPDVGSVAKLRSPVSSANKPHTSPKAHALQRQPSTSALKLKALFKGGKRDGDDSEKAEAVPLPQPPVISPPVAFVQPTSAHVRTMEDHHSGIKQLISKLRKRKDSDIAKNLIPEPLILDVIGETKTSESPQRPHYSSPKRTATSPALSQGSSEYLAQPHRSPITGSQRRGHGSIGSTGTSTMADISPLHITTKTSPLGTKIQETQYSPQAPQSLRPTVVQVDRSWSNSIDSMKKLFDAATALGLDPDKVRELIDAAGFTSRTHIEQPSEEQIIRSTIIIPQSSSAGALSDVISTPPATPPRAETATTNWRNRSGSVSSSLRRVLSTRERKLAETSATDSTYSSVTAPRQRRQSSEADISGSTSTTSTRRSVHDRAPTPPPAKVHRRQKSEVLIAENPLPPSAPSESSLSSPSEAMQPQHMGSTSLLSPTDSPDSPSPLQPLRPSTLSRKSLGSYDPRVIYGLYEDDDDNEVPPMPDHTEIDVVLASGRIPATSTDGKRGSMVLAPGVSAQRLSTTSRNSRIELSEYANGDIAFNIVQSLRAGRSADRFSFLPPDFHKRQTSENSIEAEILREAQHAEDKATYLSQSPQLYDADPLRLLVRRHQKHRKQRTSLSPEADPFRGSERRVSGDTLSSSQRSVLEVFEADEDSVGKLIEELTRGLDEGQFNVAKSGPSGIQAQEMSASHSTVDGETHFKKQDIAGIASVTRTPSKVRRNPPPVV